MKYLSTALALMMILFLSSCNENDESMFGSDDRNTESILNGGQGNIVGKITSYLNTLNMDKDTKKTVMQLRNNFVDCYNSSDDECECILNFYNAIKEANINADSQAEIMAWIKEQYPDCIPEDKTSPCEIMEILNNSYPSNWYSKSLVQRTYDRYASGNYPCDCQALLNFLYVINYSFYSDTRYFPMNFTTQKYNYPMSKEEILDLLSKTDCNDYLLNYTRNLFYLFNGVSNPYYREPLPDFNLIPM